jgi:tetratricopeptide (TPR) repeat protein
MNDTTRFEELKRRVQRDPASISFAALAEECRRLGRFEEAIETCRAGLLRHPAYVSARVTLGRALVEIGEYDAAASELEQVLRVAPENLAAIRALAEIHRRRTEMPETIDQYDPGTPAVVAPAPASAPIPLSRPAPIAVQSSPVGIQLASSAVAAGVVESSALSDAGDPPALVGLESFLAAIQRVRRACDLHAAR